MSASRRSQGLPVPRLGLVVVLLAAFIGCWLLYLGYRARVEPENVAAAPRNIVERTQFIESLVQKGSAALPQLVSMLSSPDATTRRNALDVLWRLGPDGEAAIEDVRPRLADEDPRVREDALAAFSKISRDADDLIAVAVRSLEDVDAKVRLSATLILETVGPAAMPQVLAMARGEPRADGGLLMRLLLKMDPQRDLPLTPSSRAVNALSTPRVPSSSSGTGRLRLA